MTLTLCRNVNGPTEKNWFNCKDPYIYSCIWGDCPFKVYLNCVVFSITTVYRALCGRQNSCLVLSQEAIWKNLKLNFKFEPNLNNYNKSTLYSSDGLCLCPFQLHICSLQDIEETRSFRSQWSSILDTRGLANLLLQLCNICLLIISKLSLSPDEQQRVSGLPQVICCPMVIVSDRFVLFSHMTTTLTGKQSWLHFSYYVCSCKGKQFLS